MDSGLGTITMEEEDVEADTAGDEEVEGGDGEAAIDVALDANATDDLMWNNNDPYFEIDDESSGVHRTPVVASMPLLAPTEETVLSQPSSPDNEKLHREMPTVLNLIYCCTNSLESFVPLCSKQHIHQYNMTRTIPIYITLWLPLFRDLPVLPFFSKSFDGRNTFMLN